MQFVTRQDREDLPTEFEGGRDGAVLEFTLIQESCFKGFAKLQILPVEGTEFRFADHIRQPAHALDVGVAGKQLARECRMIFARVP